MNLENKAILKLCHTNLEKAITTEKIKKEKEA